EDTAREFGKRDLVWLNVSLEGPTPQTNDPVRGAGTFTAVGEKLKLLRRPARLTLALTVLRSNAPLLPPCAQPAPDVRGHTLLPPLRRAGVAPPPPELEPDLPQVPPPPAGVGAEGRPGGGPARPRPFHPQDPRAGPAADPHQPHLRGRPARLFRLRAGRRQPV